MFHCDADTPIIVPNCNNATQSLGIPIPGLFRKQEIQPRWDHFADAAASSVQLTVQLTE